MSNGIYHEGDVQIWTDRTDDEVRLMYTDEKGDDYDVEKMIALAKQGYEVVKDFLPNIGQCALQDIGRLNDFMIVAKENFGD
jgi:hypothetical protein